jgi:hypothetical protein
MTTCRDCGEPIEFRHKDGKTTPLHFSGGCGWRNGSGVRSATALESECYPTTCPDCKDAVFFIRHNGGSVWVDPPLGPPWDKHDCMNRENRAAGGRGPGGLIQANELRLYAKSILGVAKTIEISWDRSCSVLEVITPDTESLILLIKNDPKKFFAGEDIAGELVAIDPDRCTMRLLGNRNFVWPVVAVLRPTRSCPTRSHAICPMCRMKISMEKLPTHLERGHSLSIPLSGNNVPIPDPSLKRNN